MRSQAGFSLIGSVVMGLFMAGGCGDDAKPPSSGGAPRGSAGVPGADESGGEAAAGGAGPSSGSPSGGAFDGDAGSSAALAGAPAGSCNQGKGAVISGRVLAPNGQLPLANVTVYVPSETVDPLPTGRSCWRCAAAFNGTPIALAVTGPDGRFEIDHAPTGDRVPLVVQSGKWQRQLQLSVSDCRDNPAAEEATRLPRKRSEGNLPAIALVSGAEDTLECLLRKLGIDDSEFVVTSDSGRVRLFQGKGGIAGLAGVAASTPTPAETLWSDAEKLGDFDLVLLGSEGDQNAAAKPSGALAALHEYAVTGGRVLVQHFQNYFLSAGPPDVASLATFAAQPNPSEPLALSVDESSARGKALAASLLAADPKATRGKLAVTHARNSVQAVKAPALRLLYATTPATTQAFSVDLPSAGAEPACGRITETELLTGAADKIAEFPSGCSSTTWTPQEQALAYLIFDLGACLP